MSVLFTVSRRSSSPLNDAGAWRDETERLTQQRAVADQHGAALDGNRQPLVRVERDRVGALETRVLRAQRARENAERAVRAVDVEPQVLALADAGDRIERIDRA